MDSNVCFCKFDDEQYFGSSKLELIEKLVATLSYSDLNSLYGFVADRVSEIDECDEMIDYSDKSGLGPAFEDIIWAEVN